MNYKTDFNPTQECLFQIENWLSQEFHDKGEGFYHKWDIIDKAFRLKQLVVFTENKFPIGFLYYKIDFKVLEIAIFEIHPNYRKKHFGRRFVNDALEEFKINQIIVAELFCAPVISRFFWKKIGFIDFPDFKRNDKKNRMYLPLVDTLEPNSGIKTNNVLELWNDESNIANKTKPTWTWNVTKGKLEKPIVLPVDNDWQMSLTLNGDNIEKSKIAKCSLMKDNFTEFLIIDAI